MGKRIAQAEVSSFMYILDTNAVIYYIKDDPSAVSALRDVFVQHSPVYISAITEVELFGFSALTAKEEELIGTLLRTMSSIPLDSRLARIAGSVRRKHGLKLGDSVIAATAMFTGSTLLTRNVRDFKKIPDLSVSKI